MSNQTLATLFATLAGVVARARAMGATKAVLSPGSRSVPLAYSIIKSALFQVYHIADERSAAYFALGLAKACQEPVILVCTSGTAAYNYAPAVSEAYFQHIPLWVWTADRPPEAIGQFENQAIFQDNLFGKHVRYFGQMPVDYAGEDNQRLIYKHVQSASLLCQYPTPGPVHLNFPFREPFYPPNDLSLNFDTGLVSWAEPLEPNPNFEFDPYLGLLMNKVSKGSLWVVVGMGSYDSGMADEMQKLAVIPGIKVLLDPLSNIHIQNAWNGYDHDLGHKDIPPPNAVISFGNQFLSKNLVGYLRNGKPEIHCHVQKHMDLADPIGGIGHRVFAEPAAFLRWFVPKVLPAGIQAEAHITREDLPNGRSYWEDPEMVVAEILLSALPRGCVLHMANSTPVRYLLLYQQIVSESHILTYANRGTSGIDGCVSTACGMAAAWPDRGHVLIVGDMAMVYDSNALWNTYVADNLKIVVINNNGGGIFKRIRNGGAPLGMEQYFSPAPKVSFEHLAATFGLGYMALGPEEVNAQTLGDWFGQKEKGILEIRID